MNKPCISHEEATIEGFKKNLDYAAEYLCFGMEKTVKKQIFVPLP